MSLVALVGLPFLIITLSWKSFNLGTHLIHGFV